METVNSVVNTATKMIWGEPNKQTTEPVSGQTGAGTVNDPYDKGNTDASITSDTTTEPNIGSTAPSSGQTTSSGITSSTSEPFATKSTTLGPATSEPATSALSPSGPATSEPITSEPAKFALATSAPSTSAPSTSAPSTSAPSTSAPLTSAPSTSTPATSTPATSAPADPSSTMISTSTDPTSKAQPFTNDPASVAHSSSTAPIQKQQGADRPTGSPNAAQTAAIKGESGMAEQNKDTTGTKITDENREDLAAQGKLPTLPNDHSGEPMKMHGAPVKDISAENADPRTEGKKDRSASVSHEGGGQHGKVEGTGEQWVKSTGLAAEGGDFDATKPGAAKEANRILEEKGIKKDDHGAMATEDGSSPSFSTSDSHETGVKKESKMAKLKEKLHIGHGKNLDASK